MNISVIDERLDIPKNFFIWLKTDLSCPKCGKKGLVVKYRSNGKIGSFHSSSGIILSCENWGECESRWNPIGNGREFPWHTWLSFYHRFHGIDKSRGGIGESFLVKLKEENLEICSELILIDREIMKSLEKEYKENELIKKIYNLGFSVVDKEFKI